MGAFRDGKGNLGPLSPQLEMALTAGSDYRSDCGKSYLAFLRANSRDAKELGKALKSTVEAFAAVYPGETRDSSYTNEEWRKAGYDGVAEANELLGLSRR